MLNNKSFVIDACIYPEAEFEGCAEDIKQSKLDAFFLTVPGDSFEGAIKSISRTYLLSDDETEKFKVARNYNDLIANKNNDKMSAILYFQDPYPIGNKIELVRAFYELGIRVIQMSYNKGGCIAGGGVEGGNYGLTDFGREVVKEMNRLGMLIDLSHCGEKTINDVFEVTNKPVTFCHANVYEISRNPRNKSDDQLKSLAKNGGVIGLTPWAPILWNGKKNVPPTIDDYLDHVDYVVKLIGIDHVGFASDNNLDHSEDIIGINEQSSLYSDVVGPYNTKVGTDPKERHAIGFKGATDIDNLIRNMKKRGYHDEDIDKFLGGNFLRVLKEVWR
ncbi:conserved hypothetical protein [[Clostridium] ultunense Esp]|nr:conserved hypothetical protein [[Clostridium] ultunense Esp]